MLNNVRTGNIKTEVILSTFVQVSTTTSSNSQFTQFLRLQILFACRNLVKLYLRECI